MANAGRPVDTRAVNLDDLREDQRYDQLRAAYERARRAHGLEGDPGFAWPEGDRQVVLIAARGFKDGRPTGDVRSDRWDDTLFVVRLDGGQKRVESFVVSTEFGAAGATALLAPGLHRYFLRTHHTGQPHKSLADMPTYSAEEHEYRALSPHGEGVWVIRDCDRDLELDACEELERNPSINVHYGGSDPAGPGSWSAGCQVVYQWDRYKRLIELVEQDATVLGTERNELAPPTSGGSRPVIYALLRGEELVLGGYALPLDLGAGRALTAESLAAAYAHTEREHAGGHFPIGSNTVWHGGVHLHGREGDPLHACAAGTLVAARVADGDAGRGAFGSRNFVLLRHDDPAGTFYSLLCHLGPLRPDAELGALGWVQGASGLDADLVGRLRAGALVTPGRAVQAGELLGWLGLFGEEPAPLAHWEVFAAANLLDGVAGWRAVVDEGDDFTIDAAQVFGLVEQEWTRSDPTRSNLDADEVERFYAEDAAAARKLVCKFVSEWGVPDVPAAVEAMGASWDTAGLAEQLEPYQWWSELVARGDGDLLPASRSVWHVNPLAWLAHLAGLDTSQAEAPPQRGSYRGILDGLLFETDKTLLLPGAFAAMRGLKRFYDRHPGMEVLVTGHADRSGAEDYNRLLSEERARAMAAFLRDDAAVWEGYYRGEGAAGAAWGTREDQHMLAALSDASGPFYAGTVDGAAGPGTRGAIERFQRWCNETRGSALAVDGAAGPATRAELVRAYMAQDQTTLPEGTTLLVHGCGEFHPAVETADGVSEAQNRRVEVFMFPAGVDPAPQAVCPAPGCAEYPRWRADVIADIRFEDLADAFELLVHVDLPDDYDDVFELASADGAYSTTLGLPEGERETGLVMLYFRELVPGTTYTLTHLPDPTRRIVLFSGATYEALLAPRPAPPTYDPPEPAAPVEIPWESGDEDFRWTGGPL